MTWPAGAWLTAAATTPSNLLLLFLQECLLPSTVERCEKGLIGVKASRELFHFGCERKGALDLLETCMRLGKSPETHEDLDFAFTAIRAGHLDLHDHAVADADADMHVLGIPHPVHPDFVLGAVVPVVEVVIGVGVGVGVVIKVIVFEVVVFIFIL